MAPASFSVAALTGSKVALSPIRRRCRAAAGSSFLHMTLGFQSHVPFSILTVSVPTVFCWHTLQVQFLKFWRTPNCVIYLDRMGSIAETLDFENGEILINNGIFLHVKLKRDDAWKVLQMQQRQPQQQPEGGAAVSLSGELEKLVKLRDSGALTQEEFETSKRSVMNKYA